MTTATEADLEETVVENAALSKVLENDNLETGQNVAVDYLLDNEAGSRGLPSAGEMLSAYVAWRGFIERSSQSYITQRMYEIITDDEGDMNGVIDRGATVCAPVGTGKSLAYCIGGLTSDARVLVCPHTKALQDQLIRSELPSLAEFLESEYEYELHYAILKGRNNYLNLDAARNLLEGKKDEDDDEDRAVKVTDRHKKIIQRAIAQTERAMEDRDSVGLCVDEHLNQLPSSIARKIDANRKVGSPGTTTTPWIVGLGDPMDANSADEVMIHDLDTALGNCETPHQMAYTLAIASDICVMNMSLLAFDMLASNHKGIFRPSVTRGAGVVVIDEAQHYAEVLTETTAIHVKVLDHESSVVKARKRLEKNVADEKIVAGFPALFTAFDELKATMLEVSGTDFDRDEDARDLLAEAVSKTTARLIRTSITVASHRPEDHAEQKAIKAAVADFARVQNDLAGFSESLSSRDPVNEEMFSFEVNVNADTGDEDDEREHYELHAVPIDLTFHRGVLARLQSEPNLFAVAAGRQHEVEERTSMFLFSGTITRKVGDRIGLGRYGEYVNVGSPFDPNRMKYCLVTPDGLNPWRILVNAIKAVEGRTLVLATSHRDVTALHEYLTKNFGNRYAIYRQASPDDKNGALDNATLVEKFTEDENSILIGTKSFWEGINVPGDALNLVALTKAPFPIKDDPIASAMGRASERRGRNAFADYWCEVAMNGIAQGSGRVARSITDWGGVLIMDDRIVGKSYGARLLGMLPGASMVTTNHEAFVDYLAMANSGRDDEDYLAKIFASYQPNDDWTTIEDFVSGSRKQTAQRRGKAVQQVRKRRASVKRR